MHDKLCIYYEHMMKAMNYEIWTYDVYTFMILMCMTWGCFFMKFSIKLWNVFLHKCSHGLVVYFIYVELRFMELF